VKAVVLPKTRRLSILRQIMYCSTRSPPTVQRKARSALNLKSASGTVEAVAIDCGAFFAECKQLCTSIVCAEDRQQEEVNRHGTHPLRMCRIDAKVGLMTTGSDRANSVTAPASPHRRHCWVRLCPRIVFFRYPWHGPSRSPEIESLSALLAKLPGLGHGSARRALCIFS